MFNKNGPELVLVDDLDTQVPIGIALLEDPY